MKVKTRYDRPGKFILIAFFVLFLVAVVLWLLGVDIPKPPDNYPVK